MARTSPGLPAYLALRQALLVSERVKLLPHCGFEREQVRLHQRPARQSGRCSRALDPPQEPCAVGPHLERFHKILNLNASFAPGCENIDVALDLVDRSLRNLDKSDPANFVAAGEAFVHLVALQDGKELFGVSQPGTGEVAVQGLAFACILITRRARAHAGGLASSWESSRKLSRTSWSSDLVLKKARRSRFATSERLDRLRRSENHARVPSAMGQVACPIRKLPELGQKGRAAVLVSEGGKRHGDHPCRAAPAQASPWAFFPKSGFVSCSCSDPNSRTRCSGALCSRTRRHATSAPPALRLQIF